MVKNKYINFAISNLRKARGHVIAIALLFVIASMLINTAFFLSIEYKQNFTNEKERLNGEDIDFLFADISPSAKQKDTLVGILNDNEEIKQYEINECFAGKGTYDFKDASIFNSLSFLRFEDAKNKSIGKYEILESDNGSGAYVSYAFKADAGFSIGDIVSAQIGSQTETFRIAGFYNNVDTGTINCTDTAFLLTDDCYKNLDNFGAPSYRVSVKLNDAKAADIIESEVDDEVAEKAHMLALIASSSINKTESARYITTTIFKAIIIVSSVLLIIVVLAIIAITLSSYIRSGIKNLGILKALGYRSSTLIFTIVLEFFVATLIMSALGVACSYLLFPVLNNAMECQVGIPYHIHFMPMNALATVGICVGISVLTSFLSVLKIKRILPINAIRDNRKRKKSAALFALDKTHLSLNIALSFKAWVSSKARNIIIFLSITGVAFLIGFVCMSYQNIIVNNEDVLNLICGQMSDSAVDVNVALEDSLKKELSNNDDVERFYMFNINAVAPEDMPKMYAYIVESDEHIDTERICIDGTFPSNDNEIAVNGMYANKNRLKTGDTLTFAHGDETSEFTVSGITQGAYSSGRDCYLTRDGYERFALIKDVRYYVDLKDGVDIDKFNNKLGEKCDLMFCMNYRKSVGTISQSYMSIIKIATIIVAVLSFAITAFVLYVLISVFLSNKKREHAILKALGFTSRDIIYQTVVSLLPTCIIAIVAGLWISRKGAASLFTMALNGIGIFSFGKPTSPAYLVGAGFAVLVFIIAYSMILSRSVRRITPHKLFTNE